MADSPTSRSLNELRRLGFEAGVVERWIQQARKRLDLFGVIDIVAIDPGGGVWGIQACAASSHAARRTKALDEPRLRVWLGAGCRFEVWSWGKKGKAGKRKTWTVRREEIRECDL